ncbi:ras guanine nucleotide exchange factor domain-containing protein [Coprinopsis sp. MPI-PUGE-AT-0042]|nr:ras guanine nucleotide exchange factor domain-containing protein [Coprinopsis sp. MPI-PUGE-AT-0042]
MGLTLIGGTFNNVHGNSYTYNIYSSCAPTKCRNPKRRRGGPIRKSCKCIEGTVVPSASRLDISLPAVFPQVQQSLEFIRQVIEPQAHSEGIFHRISLHLRDLGDLVQFSSLAYQACNSSTVIGKLVRCAIDTRLLQCQEILRCVHGDLLNLPHRSLPLTPFICRVVYGWWSGSEPEEITTIRSRICAEATAVAEWLCYLRLFYWAENLLHATSGFSRKRLDEFFQSGPTLLKEMHVERIIVIEPLQGEALFIPLCFAESFEDLHQIIQSACEGTEGSRYIEARQYQLDESTTNVMVDPARFYSNINGNIDDNTSPQASPRGAPQVGLYPSIQQGERRSAFDDRVNSNLKAYLNASDEGDADDNGTANATISPWTLFRRMKIEIFIHGGHSPASTEVQESLDLSLVQENPDSALTLHLGHGWKSADLTFDTAGSVKAGTVFALVAYLTPHDRLPDKVYAKTFMNTFRSFITVDVFLDFLISRYRTQLSNVAASSIAADEWRRQKQTVQLGVINSMGSLVRVNDIRDDLHILSRVESFLQSPDVSGYFPEAKILLASVREVLRHFYSGFQLLTGLPSEVELASFGSCENQCNFSIKPTVLKAKKGLQFAHIEPLEFARQLTIMESQLYQCLTVEDFQKIMDWVTDLVVSNKDLQQRVDTITRLISIANHCRSLNNFSSMTSIVTGLNRPSVSRLALTWKQISPRRQQMLHACQTIIDNISTFSSARRFMTSVKGPCVPFIGAYLSAVRSLQAGSPDPLSGGMVNFRKQQLICEVINEVKRWQPLPFKLQGHVEIAGYIEENVNQYSNTEGLSHHFGALSLERESHEREDARIALLFHKSGLL